VQTQITKLQEELAFLERNGRTLKSLSRRTLDDIANKMVNDAENMAAQMQEIRDRAGSDDPAALKAAFKAIFTELPEEEDDYESFSREASDEETCMFCLTGAYVHCLHEPSRSRG
jgi:conjugal transfer/entry exclusion protein